MAATAAVSRREKNLSWVFFVPLPIERFFLGWSGIFKRTWGEDQLNKVNALLDARDEPEAKSKGKPKLSKARTMQNTTKVD